MRGEGKRVLWSCYAGRWVGWRLRVPFTGGIYVVFPEAQMALVKGCLMLVTPAGCQIIFSGAPPQRKNVFEWLWGMGRYMRFGGQFDRRGSFRIGRRGQFDGRGSFCVGRGGRSVQYWGQCVWRGGLRVDWRKRWRGMRYYVGDFSARRQSEVMIELS